MAIHLGHEGAVSLLDALVESLNKAVLEGKESLLLVFAVFLLVLLVLVLDLANVSEAVRGDVPEHIGRWVHGAALAGVRFIFFL